MARVTLGEPLWLGAAVLTQLPDKAGNVLCKSTYRHITHTQDYHYGLASSLRILQDFHGQLGPLS